MPEVLPTNTSKRILLVIDKSGSMASTKDDVIGGINTYVEQVSSQMSEGDSAKLTLVYFDSEVHVKESDIDISAFTPLTVDTYVPGGMTAMFDGIGYAIREVAKDDAEGVKTLMVIMTDGQENSSKEYTGDGIRSIIKEKEGTGNWTFAFLGADMDAAKSATTIGISSGNTRSYAKSRSAETYRGIAAATCNLVGSSLTSTSTFFEDAGLSEDAFTEK